MDREFQVIQRIFEQVDGPTQKMMLLLCDTVINGTDAERDALEKAMLIPDYERSRERMLQIVYAHEIIDQDIRRIVTA